MIKCQHCGEWTKAPKVWEIMHNCAGCERCGKEPEEYDKCRILSDEIDSLRDDLARLRDALAAQ